MRWRLIEWFPQMWRRCREGRLDLGRAKLFVDAGLIVITAFISPYRADREMARRIIGESRFVEVYLACDLATCERRDPKEKRKPHQAAPPFPYL